MISLKLSHVNLYNSKNNRKNTLDARVLNLRADFKRKNYRLTSTSFALLEVVFSIILISEPPSWLSFLWTTETVRQERKEEGRIVPDVEMWEVRGWTGELWRWWVVWAVAMRWGRLDQGWSQSTAEQTRHCNTAARARTVSWLRVQTTITSSGGLELLTQLLSFFLCTYSFTWNHFVSLDILHHCQASFIHSADV